MAQMMWASLWSNKDEVAEVVPKKVEEMTEDFLVGLSRSDCRSEVLRLEEVEEVKKVERDEGRRDGKPPGVVKVM